MNESGIGQQGHRYLIAKKINLLESPKELVGNNIFNERPSEREFKAEVGPRFDLKGEVVKHTLVGKSDWFLKSQQNRKTYFDEATIKQTKGRLDDEKSHYDQRSLSRKLSTNDRKIKMREQLRTKNQIVDDIKAIRDRLAENQQIEDLNLQSMKPLQRQFATKQERIFQNHDERLEQWQQFVDKASSHLDRGSQMCQITQSEGFRNKVEMAQTFETLKTDQERFGNRLWYMTLRKSMPIMDSTTLLKLKSRKDPIEVEREQKLQLIVGADLPEAFKYTSLGGMKAQPEIIRKPTATNREHRFQSLFATASSTSSKPFHNFRSDEYLRNKIETLTKSHNSTHLQSFYSDEQFNKLIKVQGENKLNSEINATLSGDGTSLYKKIIFKPKPEDEPENQTLFENYAYSSKMYFPSIKRKLVSPPATRAALEPQLSKFGTSQQDFFDNQSVK